MLFSSTIKRTANIIMTSVVTIANNKSTCPLVPEWTDHGSMCKLFFLREVNE